MQCSEIISWVERHYDLLFKVDIVNLLLKNSWWWGGGVGGFGRHRKPHFIFVVWSTLVVGMWVLAGGGRKSYLGPTEIISVVYQVNSRMGGGRLVYCIALFKSQNAGGASPQPAFMDSCLTISYMYLPCLPR